MPSPTDAASPSSADPSSVSLRRRGPADNRRQPWDFDRERYGHIIDWDERSLFLHGRRALLLSGEFHYWRAPDRERWRDLLLQYRAGGLNCVRIYFHWAYHVPAEGQVVFSGARDVDYLLRLCEEVGLYVLVAPGPYICAETSAGGYPGWLLQKDELNIRHFKGHLRAEYDAEFMRYSIEWFEQFFPQIVKHQITERKTGCVLAVQIENELIQKKWIDFGLDLYMAELAMAARRAGVTTPLFHNDPWVEGSWTDDRGEGKTALDLYSFDRYIIWCPREYDPHKPPQWKTKDFAKAVDEEELLVRRKGGRATTSPIFLAELQGGWFNQWGHDHGFDEVYDYYGESYQKLLLDSYLTQGASILSLYMYWGGTNWGTLGDPDVYASYDYSACIREFGYLSGRLRECRRTAFFAHSFAEELASSDRVDPPEAVSVPAGFFAGQRRAESGANLYLMRNFSGEDSDYFELTLRSGLRVQGRLEARRSFLAVGGVSSRGGGLRLAMASMPWLARLPAPQNAARNSTGGTERQAEELWIFEANEGELIFEHGVEDPELKLEASSEGVLESRAENRHLRLRFRKPGAARIRCANGESLALLCLSREEADTLQIDFASGRIAWGLYSLIFQGNALLAEASGPGIATGFAGADGEADPTDAKPTLQFFDPGKNKTRGFRKSQSTHARVLTALQEAAVEAAPPRALAKRSGAKSPAGGAASGDASASDAADLALPLEEVSEYYAVWGDASIAAWRTIDFRRDEHDPRRHGFHYGAALYRCDFTLQGDSIDLSLNVRHRGTAWINGRLVGGHVTYGYSFFSAGAKNGPDPEFFGKRRYALKDGLRPGERNELIILTENLGYNRGPFGLADFRNRRGALEASLTSRARDEAWYIAGVDASSLDPVFNTAALPGEQKARGPRTGKTAAPWQKLKRKGPAALDGDAEAPLEERGVCWRRARFAWAAENNLRIPLRLRIDGEIVAHIFVNDIYIGRYWGDFGPQHDFYVPEGLLQNGANEILLGLYAVKPEDEGKRFHVRVLPYTIDPRSGNLRSDGPIFYSRRKEFRL